MITILGASGFIGSYVAAELTRRGIEHYAPGRDEPLTGRALGDVIYCIGLTADFRTRPFDTVEAHVTRLADAMKNCQYDSFLYLSSTRVYKASTGAHAREDDDIAVRPHDPDHLYNISKLMGESLALTAANNGKVARLSNVYGADFTSENFLTAVIRDALETGKVSLRGSPDSAKDYINVRDAVAALIAIAQKGGGGIYNVASGTNVSNRQLLGRLTALTGCAVETKADAAPVIFPGVDICRVKSEFGFAPSSVLDDLKTLVETYKSHAAG